MKEIKINQNDANQRLDKFLMKTFPKLGKSMMYKAIRNKKIKVNRKRCTFDQKIQENDSILLFLPPDVLEEKKVETNYISSKLDVIYEDENILIVNKPYGLLSQSDQRQNQDCLVNRVQAYLMEKNEYDPNKEHSFAPSICHRLDRNFFSTTDAYIPNLYFSGFIPVVIHLFSSFFHIHAENLPLATFLAYFGIYITCHWQLLFHTLVCITNTPLYTA